MINDALIAEKQSEISFVKGRCMHQGYEKRAHIGEGAVQKCVLVEGTGSKGGFPLIGVIFLRGQP